VVFSVLLLGGVAGGLLPATLLALPLLAVPAGVCAVMIARQRGGRRLGELVRGASAITPTVVAWLGLVLALRLGVAVSLLHSLGVDSPIAGGVILLAALGAAGAVALTPGNIGVASAAVAIALAHRGVEPGTAAAVGIAYHGLETVAGLGFGALGCLLRIRPSQAQALS
jgi:uncharacterized membrane protein YbhN (UPF0104 family)